MIGIMRAHIFVMEKHRNDMSKIKKFVLNEFSEFNIITAGNSGESVILDFSATGNSDEEIKQKLDRIAINFRIYFNLVLKRKYNCTYLDFQPLAHSVNYAHFKSQETKVNSELNFQQMLENKKELYEYLNKKIDYSSNLRDGLDFINKDDLFKAYGELVIWLERYQTEIEQNIWTKFWSIRSAKSHTDFTKRRNALNYLEKNFEKEFDIVDNELIESNKNKATLKKYLPELLDLVEKHFMKKVF